MIKATPIKFKRAEVLPKNLEIGTLYDFVYNSNSATVTGVLSADGRFIEMIDVLEGSRLAPLIWFGHVADKDRNFGGKFYLSEYEVHIKN